MFSSKLTCSNCNKEIESNEKIAIIVPASDLNGITNLKSWARYHRILCPSCQQNSAHK